MVMHVLICLQVLITLWWFISAHRWFKGPKVNLEHMMLDRNVIEGFEPASERSGSDDDERVAGKGAKK